MKKRVTLPGFLIEYNSIKNPILLAFAGKISSTSDKNQTVWNGATVGLIGQKPVKMIDPEVLKEYGSKEVSLRKDSILFREGEEALNYFQVAKGSVKMITNSPDGKEFIQGIFRDSDSFGEPPLFCSFPYPSAAVALEPTTVIKLAKDKFFRLLHENFDIHLVLDKVLCERLKYKSMVLSEISSYDPEHRIMSLLKYLKGEPAHLVKSDGKSSRADARFIVPFTRQQIADMSGLRVETVIRTVKRMEEEGKLKVVSRKIAL